MRISVTEFAESRGTDRDTVNAYIRRNPNIKEQTEREGKNVILDTESETYQLLDKQYPLPKPIQIIEDTESRQELIKAQKVIIQLQNKLTEHAELIAKAEATQILLEDKEQAIKEKNEQILKQCEQMEKLELRAENERKRSDDKDEEIKELRAKLEEQSQELEKERSKSWWDKLRGK